jgi:hypothetical protein
VEKEKKKDNMMMDKLEKQGSIETAKALKKELKKKYNKIDFTLFLSVCVFWGVKKEDCLVCYIAMLIHLLSTLISCNTLARKTGL